MKSTHSKNEKSGKRTHTLKEILERQAITTRGSMTGVNVDSGASLNTSAQNLFEIEEDLPNLNPNEVADLESVHFNFGRSPQATRVSTDTPSNLSKSIDLLNGLIYKEAHSAAKLLEIDQEELKAWLDLQLEVPAKTILNLLRTMQNLQLDPLNEEIGFTQYEDGAWQVFITIEGCSKILNQHSQFNGLVFNQADTLVDGVPEWIECSIFRRDRIMPITVREYLIEVRNEKEIWKKMPRRMLRHRALQQCVRLAVA